MDGTFGLHYSSDQVCQAIGVAGLGYDHDRLSQRILDTAESSHVEPRYPT